MRMARLVVFFTLMGMLYALAPPQIPQPLDEVQEAMVGDTVVLSCDADASSNPILTWTKDGESIHRGWIRFKLKNDGLRIKDVELEDAGFYICRATNGYGFDEITYTLYVKSNDSATLPPDVRNTNIQGDLPHFNNAEQMESNVMRSAGTTVRLKCAATGNPPPQIAWYKDNSLLRRPSHGGDDGEDDEARWTLKLKDLRETDTGAYTCKVSNIHGTIRFTYTLEVVDQLDKPVIRDHPLNRTALYGEMASFQCRVHSEVRPTIQWLKRVDSPYDVRSQNRTIEIENQQFVVLETGEVVERDNGVYLNKLTIHKVKMGDGGRYICLGVNSMGTSFKDAYLTVLPSSGTTHRDSPTPVFVDKSLPLIIAVPCLLLVVILVVVVVCLCKKSRTNSRPKTVTTTVAVSNGVRKPHVNSHQHHHNNKNLSGLSSDSGIHYDHHYTAVPMHTSQHHHHIPHNIYAQPAPVHNYPPAMQQYPPLVNGGMPNHDLVLKNYGDINSDVSSIPQIPTPHNSHSSSSSYTNGPHSGHHTHLHYTMT